MTDRPHLRNHTICPLCGGPKDKGLLVCWPCHREWGLRYGNPDAEAVINAAERDLAARTMRVAIYEADGRLVSRATLGECFPDDGDARHAAAEEIERNGYVITGGGAAPTFRIEAKEGALS